MDINKLYQNLRNLRTHNGLYLASTGEHYRKIWIRDTFYAVLPELKNNPKSYEQTYHTLLDFYINMETKYNKLTWLIKEPYPKYGYRYPHPRMTIELDEIDEEWGFKQHDAVGAFLYGIWLGESNGLHIIRDDNDRHIINLLIQVLESLEYWDDPDNGIWEEGCEKHLSSIGACVAGLLAIRKLGFNVNQRLIDNGYNKLNELLPCESVTKDVDLALLSLIYPFNIVDESIGKQILYNVETHLLRDRGVIRYRGDRYYNRANPQSHICDKIGEPMEGNEAEWCMGLAYLSLSYLQYGNIDKAKYYLYRLEKCYQDGNIPELFYSRTDITNDNNPLMWAVSMAIMTIEAINDYKNKTNN